MDSLFQFPGDPDISRALSFGMEAFLWLVLFGFAVRILLYYVPPRSDGNKILGKSIGLVLSVVMARGYLHSYIKVFEPYDETIISLVLLAGIIVNLTIIKAAYDGSSSWQPPANPPSPAPTNQNLP